MSLNELLENEINQVVALTSAAKNDSLKAFTMHLAAKKLVYILKNQNSTKIVLTMPEISHLPKEIDPAGIITTGSGGGLSVVQGTIFAEGYLRGLDIHAVLPDYRRIFKKNSKLSAKDFDYAYRRILMHPNIHLVDDGLFERAHKVYDDDSASLRRINVRRGIHLTKGIMSTAKDLDLLYPESYKIFQQNDWQTALSAAALKEKYCNVTTELKIHGPHTVVRPLRKLDEHGFNTKSFHKKLLYDDGFPSDDHVTNLYNRNVDFLASGILAADKIDLVGYKILDDIKNWRLKDLKDEKGNNLKVLSEKMTQAFIDRYYETLDHNTVGTVANEPSRYANPSLNPHLEHKYGTEDIMEGKAINKAKFQQEMGLNVDSSAPILYWPHRLSDPQKGTKLFLNSIDDLMNTYKDDKLQIAFVADGEFEFTEWARVLQEKYEGRVAIVPFTNKLSELGKAGSDFIMMPSLFEPRGLPQLEGPIYGTLPIVSKYVDGITSYDKNPNMGNGWVFENYDHGGIKWAVGEAIKFFKKPYEEKKRHLQKVRDYQLKEHNVDKMIDSQIYSWETMLDRKNQKLILRAA